jgi:hypothetical protein
VSPAHPDRTRERETRLEESGRSLGREDLLASRLPVDAVGQRELQALDEELLHVWAADVGGLRDLDNLEDLCNTLAVAWRAVLGSDVPAQT